MLGVSSMEHLLAERGRILFDFVDKVNDIYDNDGDFVYLTMAGTPCKEVSRSKWKGMLGWAGYNSRAELGSRKGRVAWLGRAEQQGRADQSRTVGQNMVEYQGSEG